MNEELLILAKTYPQPSKQYGELSCVAAVNRQGALRRIYPVPFRLMEGEKQFHKWDWISADVEPRDGKDKRPESRKIDVNSILHLGEIGTKNAWRERRSWLEPLLAPSLDALEEQRKSNETSLGFVRPSRILKLEITPLPEKDQTWTSEELAYLTTEGLFDSEEVKQRPRLEKVPFTVHYHYELETPEGTQQHKSLVLDWELGALWRNCRRLHGEAWEAPFRAKLEQYLPSRDLIFMMGTHHRFDHWMIIAPHYPPHPASTEQLGLFAEEPPFAEA